MNDNPYVSPNTSPDAVPRPPRAAGSLLGAAVFVVLGVLLIPIGGSALASVLAGPGVNLRGHYFYAALPFSILVLGAVMVAHGIVRNDRSERILAISLTAVVLMIVLQVLSLAR